MKKKRGAKPFREKQILEYLLKKEEATSSDISKKFLISRSNASVILVKMTRAGFLNRKPRSLPSFQYSISEKGRKKLERKSTHQRVLDKKDSRKANELNYDIYV